VAGTPSRRLDPIQGRVTYWWQRTTRTGVDQVLEQQLRDLAGDHQHRTAGDPDRRPVSIRTVDDLQLDDTARYDLVRDDIYQRFVADEAGGDVDSFGRQGTWVPRGSLLYLDTHESVYVKIFDTYFCAKGEGRFLSDALESGLYDVLCPGLEFVVTDGEHLRGYGITAGTQLSRYQFDRYVGGCLRPVVCDETARTGLFFNDLAFHNVIRHGESISLIDLESVLPISWFGTNMEFARRNLDVVDIGWSIQSKWNSPAWYGQFLTELTEGTDKTSEDEAT